MVVASGMSASAQTSSSGESIDVFSSCWKTPNPQTIEETAVHAGNLGSRASRQRQTTAIAEPAALALSGGTLKAAFGAGLLVGWSETGHRPSFDVVTAVGTSTLIAPFAFVGGDVGDRKLADVFNCASTSWDDVATRASDLLDDTTLAVIANKHKSGGRLLVALPGSPARRETVWDLGAIAASGHTQTASLLRDILLAAVRPETFIDPDRFPIPAGRVEQRNHTFRQIGSGEPFLAPGPPRGRRVSTYLIHHGVLFPDESAGYIAERRRHDGGWTSTPKSGLVTAYDLAEEAGILGSRLRFSSVPERTGVLLPAQGNFDLDYMRRLFFKYFRQGRLGWHWESALPGQPVDRVSARNQN
jgi:hypothetical protein